MDAATGKEIWSSKLQITAPGALTGLTVANARVYFGPGYQQFVELSTGDFMFVPPFLPHLEVNMSTTEELWWITCRSPENIVVNLPDVDDASIAGYRRV